MQRRLLPLIVAAGLWPTSAAFAQDAESLGLTPTFIGSSLLYGLIGILLYVAGYWAFDRFMHLELRRELVEDQNMALGIMLAGLFIGLGIIIAAAIT